MKSDFNELLNLWTTEYSPRLETYQSFKSKAQLELFANIFSPGNTYFYVLNMHNLNLDYVSKNIDLVLGLKPEEATINKIVSTAHPDYYEDIANKESCLKDFFLNFIDKNKTLDYKALYTYKMINFRKEEVIMINQVSFLSTDEKDNPMHALSIHTKIDHLQKTVLPYISFISLTEGPSFYNVSIEGGTFNPKRIEDTSTNLLSILTKREIEIVKQISNGLNANEIANILSISPHTVRTHKKNILCKAGVKNTAELLAKGYMEGLLI